MAEVKRDDWFGGWVNRVCKNNAAAEGSIEENLDFVLID